MKNQNSLKSFTLKKIILAVMRIGLLSTQPEQDVPKWLDWL
jgi:hypothetical protein